MRNDAVSVVSKLAASPNNVFTSSQAAAHSLTRRQLRSAIERGLIVEPHRGVFVGHVPDGGPTWHQQVAAATAGRDGVVASHRSAARLARLEGFEHEPSTEASIETPRLVRLDGVIGHRVRSLPRCDFVMVDGIRCTNVARTLVDLGDVVDPDRVERAFDHSIRTGANPRWLRQTAERLVRPNVVGPALLLHLLDRHEQRGTVRGSWFERMVELCLVHPELDGLVIQYELRNAEGGHVATFDLAVPDAMLGIEAHSREHHFGAENEASDEHRDNAAGVEAWDVMYLGYESVQSPSAVRDLVVARVRARRRLIGGSAS